MNSKEWFILLSRHPQQVETFIKGEGYLVLAQSHWDLLQRNRPSTYQKIKKYRNVNQATFVKTSQFRYPLSYYIVLGGIASLMIYTFLGGWAS